MASQFGFEGIVLFHKWTCVCGTLNQKTFAKNIPTLTTYSQDKKVLYPADMSKASFATPTRVCFFIDNSVKYVSCLVKTC